MGWGARGGDLGRRQWVSGVEEMLDWFRELLGSARKMVAVSCEIGVDEDAGRRRRWEDGGCVQ